MSKAGERVFAIRNANAETVYMYGRGTYVGDEIPPPGVKIFGIDLNECGRSNPKIQLDSGDAVWGCQCWWGPEAAYDTTVGGRKVEIVPVPEENRPKTHLVPLTTHAQVPMVAVEEPEAPEWVASMMPRRVKKTVVGPFYVSTVELPKMVPIYAEAPFETMFFAPDEDVPGETDGLGQQRHATEEEAVAFHDEVVRRVRNVYQRALKNEPLLTEAEEKEIGE